MPPARTPPDLASSMFPNLSREVKQREAAQQRQAADHQRRKARKCNLTNRSN
jgi:hypothetical protein